MIDFIPYEPSATFWLFIQGDRLCDILGDLTLRDKDYLIQDLCSRITAMYRRIQKDDHVCSNVLHGLILSSWPPWVFHDDRQLASTYSLSSYVAKVWTILNIEIT